MTMTTPIISIIIPCYNQAEYLSETLQSVLEQKYREWECIIVNDGSSDKTEDIAREWCEKDDRFKYFSKDNSGVSDTRNYGIGRSKGEYIFPLDADDLIDSHFLSEGVEVFLEKPNTKLVYSNIILFGVKNEKVKSIKYNFANMLVSNQISCTALFRRSDFDKTEGYNINMVKGLEDWDFWLTFLNPTDIVVKLEGHYLYYRIKEVSRSTSIDKENNEMLILQIFKNHTSLYLQYFNPIRDHIEADYYKKRVHSIQNSVEFKIGSILYFPFRILKKICRKLFN